jgi:hypothetical protein
MNITFDELIDIACSRLNGLRGAKESISSIGVNAGDLGMIFQILGEIEKRLMPLDKHYAKEFRAKVNEYFMGFE